MQVYHDYSLCQLNRHREWKSMYYGINYSANGSADAMQFDQTRNDLCYVEIYLSNESSNQKGWNDYVS